MATDKSKKQNNNPEDEAKTPQTDAQKQSTPPASEPTEPKPVIDPAAAKSTATQNVQPTTTPAKPSADKPAAQTKPAEKPPEPTVKPAAAQVSQPPEPAKPLEPATAKASQPAYTPPATPAKSVVAPPPATPVSATVTSSQPSMVKPDVELSSDADSTFQEIKLKVVAFLENLPENTAKFFQQNQKPLISLGLILALLITLKITAGLLDILNEIPLVKTLFEAVGVTYSAWFIYRYLLWSNTRQELWKKVDETKQDILGENR
ncbi:MAG: CAAD domain-containing protein [Microcoleaceae cyanobacterium]